MRPVIFIRPDLTNQSDMLHKPYSMVSFCMVGLCCYALLFNFEKTTDKYCYETFIMLSCDIAVRGCV
nr:MAG TPA: hypothetical protein [Caudoviricetes sp.]